MKTTIISMPTISQFGNLFQNGKLPHSCPCSQIAIKRSQSISLTFTLHQVCSSDLVTENMLDSLRLIYSTRNQYDSSDIRLYGLNMLQTVSSLCSLANKTIIDAMTTFLTTNWVSTHVLSREQFYKEAQVLIMDFQSNVENSFKQMFNLVRQTNQGNQLLTAKGSNFFSDGLFNIDGHLISVQTYFGTKSSLTNTSASCSCALNTCVRQLGFVETRNDGETIMIEIPGMYTACYPLDAHQMSTLECWFNETCVSLVLFYLLQEASAYFEVLNPSRLVRFTSNTTIGDIIGDLMIEMWTNSTNYEMYYNICKPLTCTYTSYRRFDWLYTITILASVFGGLSVSLRVICPLLIKFYFYIRRKRTVPISSKYLATSLFSLSLSPFIKMNQQLCASVVFQELLVK